MAAEAEKPQEEGTAGKGSSTKKTLIVVVAVMVLEAGAIIGTMILSKGPSNTEAMQLAKDQQAMETKLVEIQLAKAKFVNTKKGKVMLYDTEVFARVQHRHKDQVEKQLETEKNWIEAQIDAVFRRADPVIFNEPEHATLERQIMNVVGEHFGKDADDKPVLKEIFVKKLIEFPTE